MKAKNLGAIHPGEILLKEFMEPMGISQYRLAKSINVPIPRVHAVVNCQRSITADTALRLSKYFGLSEEYWLNLQKHYELELAKQRLGKKLDKEIKPYDEAI